MDDSQNKTDNQINNQPPNRVNWKQKFFKTVPIMGADGKPLQGDRPFNSGFKLASKETTKAFFDEHIRHNKAKSDSVRHHSSAVPKQ